MEETDSTEETDIRPADKGKCAEKTAELSAGRKTAAEAVSEEVAVDENGNPIAEEETVSEAEAVSVEEAADPAEEETPADAVPAE